MVRPASCHGGAAIWSGATASTLRGATVKFGSAPGGPSMSETTAENEQVPAPTAFGSDDS